MQTAELEAMTVVQLRKLAKENGVKLSAGIDKAGIVGRLAEALGEEKPAAPIETATDPETEKEAETEPAAVSDPPARQEEKSTTEMEKLQEAPLSADVTASNGFRPWTNQEGAYQPVYRQAWQARATREQAKPAWQSSRPVSTVNRFGPQSRPQPSQDQRPAQAEPARRQDAPSLDGYRLGSRAAPQRPSYQSRGEYNRNDGGFGYQPRGYQQNNYQQQPNHYRGGYQPRPATYPQPMENNYNDGLYRMNRDPQFGEQADAGQLPEMMQLGEMESVGGILEILPDGYGFLRGSTLLPGKKDIYVSMAQVRRYGLRTGDRVDGKARARREGDKFAALLYVEQINGQAPDEKAERPLFEQLVPIYPNRRIVLEGDGTEMAMRLVDLIAPIGFGQRAMIVSPPDSGRLVILREMSRAIRQSDPDAEVMMLLLDVAPEDVTEIRESVNAEVFASTFADAPDTQTRVSETMLERAQRLVESGRNVVILLDSLTKLTRAYQAALAQGGRPMTNTVTPAALVKPKRFFGAARNTREGGSLTVIATIATQTDSRVDDIIFEEFKGTANMELTLCTHQNGDPVYPMIDLQKSGTKKDNSLLSEEQKEGLRAIRKVLGATTNGEAVVQLIEMIQKTKCNADLFSRLQDWIGLWEKSGYLKR